MTTKRVGVLLAGGMSRRFGSPKAFAKLDQAYFYELALEALSPFCDKLVIVTRPELIQRFPQSLLVIKDQDPFVGLGPLAGIYSAMEAVEGEEYVILPCDMPYVTASVIEKLLKQHKGQLTAVIADGKHHPLVSIWNHTMKKPLYEALVAKELKVMVLQEKYTIQWIEGRLLTEDVATTFANVNTPDSLEKRS